MSIEEMKKLDAKLERGEITQDEYFEASLALDPPSSLVFQSLVAIAIMSGFDWLFNTAMPESWITYVSKGGVILAYAMLALSLMLMVLEFFVKRKK